MRLSSRRFGAAAPGLALALFACAKPAALPDAQPAAARDCTGTPKVCSLSVVTGQPVTLDGSGSTDPSGKNLHYAWSFQSVPAGSRSALLLDATPNPVFTPDIPGGYDVQLVVRDDFFASIPKVVKVTASDCGANVPTIGSLVATPAGGGVNVPVSLTAPAVDDKDNDSACQVLLGKRQVLAYAWSIIAQPPGSRAHLNDAASHTPAFVPDVNGQYIAQLIVTDDTGRSSAPQQLPISIQACGNALPVIGAVNNTPSTPGIGIVTQLSAVVTDADADAPCSIPQTFSYKWSITSLPQASHASLNSASVSTPSFTPDQAGSYSFRLVVTNQANHQSLAKDFTVGVTSCGNAPPVPTVSFAPASAGVGTPVQLSVAVTDDDFTTCGLVETFSYQWRLSQQPQGSAAHFNDATAANPSFVPDQPGTFVVALIVTDSSGTVAAPVVANIIVKSCGLNPPSIDTLTSTPANPTAGPRQHVVVTPATSDGDSNCFGYSPQQTFAWALVAKPAGSGAFVADPGAQAADFIADLPGSYQLQLIVTDATGLSSAPKLVTIKTNTSCGLNTPVIDPAAAGADNLAPNPGQAIQLFALATDADNLPPCNSTQTVALRWAITSRPAHSTAALSDPNAARPGFTPDLPGSYQFSVFATDSTGLRSAPAWVTITATNCGQGAISVAATPAAIDVSPNLPVQLSATPSAADSICGLSETFTYAWQIVSEPGGSNAVLSDPSSPAPIFHPDLAGDYSLSVTAADQRGHVSTPAFVKVSVGSCRNLGPSVDFLTATAAVLGNSVTVAANQATDRNCVASGALTYAWALSALPPGSAAMLDNPIAQSPRFTPDVAGAYQLSLVVTDNLGLSSLPVFKSVTVAPCTGSTITWAAQPIVATFAEPDTGALSAPPALPDVGSQISLSAAVRDANPGCANVSTAPFTYRWALLSRPAGSAARLSSSSAATSAFVPDLAGSYQIAAQVTDALGTVSTTQYTTLTTSLCGTQAPVVQINPSTAQSVSSFAPHILKVADGFPTDADADPAQCPARFAPAGYTYRWSIASAPVGSAPQLSASAGAQTSFEAFSSGSYTVQLVATTSGGISSAPATVTFAVGSCGSHPPEVTAVTDMSGSSTVARPAVGLPTTLTAQLLAPDVSCGDTIASVDWQIVSLPSGSAIAVPTPSSDPTFTFTPDVAGTYSLTVTATDTNGLVSQPFPVSVTTAACGPSLNSAITASNLSPILGETVTLSVPQISGAPDLTDACVPGASYAYAWSIASAPAHSAATLSSRSGLSTNLVPDRLGSYLLQLVVTDSAGFSSAPAQVLLTAASCGNGAPVLNDAGAGSPIAAASARPDAGDLVALSVPGIADPNGACAVTQPYAYLWAIVAHPAGSKAKLTSATDAVPTLVPDVPGAYQLSVTVTDQQGNSSAPGFLTLRTSSCGANLPTVSIAPSGALSINSLTPLTLTATAADADNSCPARFNVGFTYRWSIASAPVGGSASLSSATAAATVFQSAVAGSYTVQVVAVASNGLVSAPALAPITVGQCGSSVPSIVSVTTRVAGNPVSRPAVGAAVTLTAQGFDADNVGGGVCTTGLGQALSYDWTIESLPAGSTANIPSTQGGSPALTFTADVAGTYLFNVSVSDGTGLRSPPYRVAVPTGSCGPDLASLSASTLLPQPGQAVTLSHLPATLSSSCVSGGTITYGWSVVSRPPASSAGFDLPASEAQTFTPDAPGGYTLQLVATDSGGFSTSAQVTLTAGGCSSAPTFSAVAESANGVSAAVPDRDDRVTLSVTGLAPGSCGGAPASTYSYQWALLASPRGSHAALSSSTGPTPTFLADVPGGTWQAMVVVTDQYGNASVPGFISVTASSCGRNAPTAAFTAAPGTAPDTFQEITLTAQTPANPNGSCPARFQVASYTYAWSLVAQPAGGRGSSLVPSGASAAFTGFSPGAYAVQLVATGSDGIASAPLSIPIAVQQCGGNAPSAIDVGPTPAFVAAQAGSGKSSSDLLPVTLDTNLPVLLGANVIDLDTQPGCGLTGTVTEAWSLVGVPAGSQLATLTNANTAAPGLTPDLPGTYRVQLVSTDSTGLSSLQTFSFDTGACGTHAPVARTVGATPAFSVLQAVPGGATITNPAALDLHFAVQVQANVVDDDALCGLLQPVTQRWSLTAPAGSRATLDSAQTSQPSFVPDVTGPYTLGLVLTDSSGLSSSQGFTVTASCGGAAPQAVDAAGLPALSASQLVANVTLKSGASTLTVPTLPIVHSTLASGAPNTNPNVAFYPGVPVTLGAHVVDADSSCGGGYPETISYAWSFASTPPGSHAALVNSTSSTPSFVPDVAGGYPVRLVLTDSTGLSSTQIFPASVVTVGTCGQQGPTAAIALTAPASLPGPLTSISVSQGTLLALDGASSKEPDATPLDLGPTPSAGCGLSRTLSYAWSFVSQPPNSGSLSITNGQFANPSFTPPVPGAYGLRLFVSDGSLSSFSDLLIAVTGPSATTSTVVANPLNPVVGPSPNGTTVTVTVADGSGQPLLASQVTLSATGSANTFAPASGVTDGNGVFTTLFTSTKAEAKTIAAVADGISLAPNSTVTFQAGPGKALFFAVQPTNAVKNLDITPSPVVQAADLFGNQTSFAGPVTLSLTPNTGTLNGTLTRNAGVAFGGLSVDTVGSTYHLLANSAGLTQATSDVFAVTTAPTGPPTNLIDTPGAQQITLHWTTPKVTKNGNLVPDPNVTGYSVFRCLGGTCPSGTGTLAGTTGVNTASCGGISSPCFTDPSLADGTQYSYYVEAFNGSTLSVPSNVDTDFTLPAAAINISAAGGNGSVLVSWTAGPGQTDSFMVRRANSLNGTFGQVGSNITGTGPGNYSMTDSTNVNAGTIYFYKIVSVLNTTEFTTSSAVAATPTLPGQVTNLNATAQSDHTIRLTWNSAGSTITSYLVSRGTTVAGTYTDAFSVPNGTSFDDVGLVPGQTYHYAIQAVNATGASPQLSADASDTTGSAPWTAAGAGLNGGNVSQVVVDSTGARLFAVTGTSAATAGGVFKSTNSGVSWTSAGSGIPNGVLLTSVLSRNLAGATNQVFAGSNGAGVFMSRDDGLTWRTFNGGLTDLAVTSLFYSSAFNKLLAGTQDGQIFFTSLPVAGQAALASFDANWQAATTASTGAVLGLVQDASGNLFAQVAGGASSGGGLFASADGGATFSAQNASLVTLGCSDVSPSARAIAVDGSSTTLYWGSSACGVLTADTSVSPISFSNLLPAADTQSVQSLAAVQGNVWIGVTSGPIKFYKGGVSYTTFSAGPTNATSLAVPISNPNTLYASAADGTGLYKSINAKAAAPSASIANTGLTNAAVTQAAFNPRTLASFVVGSFNDSSGTHFSAGESADGTAYAATNATTCTSPAVFGVDAAANPSIIYEACGGAGVYFSVDDGAHWTLSPATPPASTAFSPVIAVQNANVGSKHSVYVAANGVLYKSTDPTNAAKGFSAVSMTGVLPLTGAVFTAIAVDETDNLYLSTQAGTFQKNGSNPWIAAPIGTQPKSAVALFVDTHPNTDVIYTADSSVGVVSNAAPSDGSAPSWSSYGNGLPSSVTGFGGFVRNGAPDLFAGTALTPNQTYANLFHIRSSSSWATANDGLTGGNVLRFLDLDGANVIAGTSGRGIFVSTSGGQ